jgi:hypothetical protein
MLGLITEGGKTAANYNEVSRQTSDFACLLQGSLDYFGISVTKMRPPSLQLTPNPTARSCRMIFVKPPAESTFWLRVYAQSS